MIIIVWLVWVLLFQDKVSTDTFYAVAVILFVLGWINASISDRGEQLQNIIEEIGWLRMNR